MHHATATLGDERDRLFEAVEQFGVHRAGPGHAKLRSIKLFQSIRET
jgi:hypothetical protein